MPNYSSLFPGVGNHVGGWVKLSDDPVKASAEQAALKLLTPLSTLAQVDTSIKLTDATVHNLNPVKHSH